MFNSSIKLSQVILLPLSVLLVNSPVVQLLVEVVLTILIRELWEHLSVVPEIVDQCLKRLSISIQEDLVVHLLQLVHIREELGQSGALH